MLVIEPGSLPIGMAIGISVTMGVSALFDRFVK